MKRIAMLIGVALVIASFSFGAVACSDDDDGDGGTTPQATEPVETSAPTEGETPSATEGTPVVGTEVSVNLSEYIVAPDPASVPPGPVAFVAHNIGGTEHELVVFKTDLAADALPTADDGSVDELAEGVELIDEVEEIAAGSDGEVDVDLEAGNYVLICNVVQENEDGSTVIHYAEGMYAAFAVE
jgi:hypothetical protein